MPRWIYAWTRDARQYAQRPRVLWKSSGEVAPVITPPKGGRGTSTDFKPALAIEPFASPFLGPVEPVFLEAERLVRRVA